MVVKFTISRAENCRRESRAPTLSCRGRVEINLSRKLRRFIRRFRSIIRKEKEHFPKHKFLPFEWIWQSWIKRRRKKLSSYDYIHLYGNTLTNSFLFVRKDWPMRLTPLTRQRGKRERSTKRASDERKNFTKEISSELLRNKKEDLMHSAIAAAM